MTCKHNADHLMLYLADVLNRAEQEALDKHLQQGCAQCEARLVEARRTLEAIPVALEPQQPPAAVRARLLAQLEPVKSTGADQPALHLVGGEMAPAVPRGRRAGVVGRVVGACAAAAAVAACVTFVVMDQQVDRQASELAQLRERVGDYDRQLADYSDRTGRLERWAEVAGELYATLRSAPVEMVRMQGVDEYEDASGRLIWDRSRNVGHFVGPEEFRPKDGRRLELWLVSGDEGPLSVGTFALDEFGWGLIDFGLPELDFSSFDSAYISYDEPAGDDADADGKPGPRQVLLSGNF